MGSLGTNTAINKHKQRLGAQTSCRVSSILVMAQTGTPTHDPTPYAAAVNTPPIYGHLSNSTPTDAFAEFVQRKRQEYEGRDGYGRVQGYVPHNELLKYWTPARIRDACESYSEGITTRHDLIRKHYLRVFSTLVYIGKLSYIPAFQQYVLEDGRFPDTTPPGPLAQAPSYKSMFDDFKDHQWIFFPVVLDRDKLDNTWLPSERILPICMEETIRSQLHSERASITKVQFHPSCNKLAKVS